jgi:hypothetical protein
MKGRIAEAARSQGFINFFVLSMIWQYTALGAEVACGAPPREAKPIAVQHRLG